MAFSLPITPHYSCYKTLMVSIDGMKKYFVRHLILKIFHVACELASVGRSHHDIVDMLHIQLYKIMYVRYAFSFLQCSCPFSINIQSFAQKSGFYERAPPLKKCVFLTWPKMSDLKVNSDILHFESNFWFVSDELQC